MYLYQVPKRRKSGRAYIYLLVLLVLLCGGAIVLRSWVYDWARNPILLQQDVIAELRPTESLKHLSKELFEKKLISHPLLFQAFVRLEGNYAKFQAGRYLFSGTISPLGIIQKMTKGEVYVPVVVQIIVPEGFNLRQIADRLAANKIGTPKSIDAALRDREFIRSLKVPASTLEGFIYPATYSFSEYPTERAFFKQAVETFWARLPEKYEANLKEHGLTLTDAVNFASMIELETKYDDEKPMVSEVIWRRLKRGEPLGIDAALIYGILNYDGNIRTRDLKNAKNPYNTRIHKGLPPTPIGSVSTTSLLAVLNPSDLGYYYYVLKVNGQGRHQFSKTLDEHNRFVRELTKSYHSKGRY